MIIAGIDEAGRGPLAGPVVAASVVLDEAAKIEGLNDSKRLTSAVREELFDRIQRLSVAFGIGMATPTEIDNHNILQATLLAMRRAYSEMNVCADVAWVDGISDPGLPTETRTLIQGDGKMAEISAASILAKVTRDRIMIALAETHPEYGFDKHKGYPTALHKQRLKEFGPCPIHRRSFLPVQQASLGL